MSTLITERELDKMEVEAEVVVSRMEDEFDDGNAPPDVVLRGHFHEYISEVLTKFHRDKYYTSRMVILPSYCMLDDYARQATKSIS